MHREKEQQQIESSISCTHTLVCAQTTECKKSEKQTQKNIHTHTHTQNKATTMSEWLDWSHIEDMVEIEKIKWKSTTNAASVSAS